MNINSLLYPHTNNSCKLVNIVWVDRGIKLAIIYFIIKNYKHLHNKRIIIEDSDYRAFAKQMFPEFKFREYTKDSNKNFYFNIRKIIKEQDVIIDIIKNHDKYIYGDKLMLLPWYDMNDPIIMYQCSDMKHKKSKYMDFVTQFSLNRRCNYMSYDYINYESWDIYVEKYIFQRYIEKKQNTNYSMVYNIFNQSIMSKYNNPPTYNREYPMLYYTQPVESYTNYTNNNSLESIIQQKMNEKYGSQNKSNYNKSSGNVIKIPDVSQIIDKIPDTTEKEVEKPTQTSTPTQPLVQTQPPLVQPQPPLVQSPSVLPPAISNNEEKYQKMIDNLKKDHETNIKRIILEGDDNMDALVKIINRSMENVINIHTPENERL